MFVAVPSRSVRLDFVRHPWSGHARVRAGGTSRTLELYSPEGGLEHIGIQPQVPLQQHVASIWIRMCDAVLLGLALWMAWSSLVLINWSGKRITRVSRAGEALTYALPTFGSAAALLLVFFPGIVTTDSLDQWQQAVTGRYVDHHPVLYALFIRAIRQLVDSPAAVVLVTALLSAAATGWLVMTLRRAVAAPRWAAWVGACLPALYPLTAVFTITVWKDIPYSASVVALTAFLVTLASLDATRRPRAVSWLAFSLLLFACMGLRHNGWPVAIAAVVLVILIRRDLWRHAALSSALALGLLSILKGPVYEAIDVQPGNAAPLLVAHHLAAHLSQGNLPSQERDRALLETVNSGEAWPYTCALINSTVNTPHFNRETAARNLTSMLRILVELALRRPDVQAAHVACVTSMLWDSWPATYLYSFPFETDEEGYIWTTGVANAPPAASKAPTLAQGIAGSLMAAPEHFAWRPAPFLFVLMFTAAVALRRHGGLVVLLVPTLIVINTAGLFLMSVAQDARYQAPLYVVSLVTLPLLLTSARSRRSRWLAAARARASSILRSVNWRTLAVRTALAGLLSLAFSHSVIARTPILDTLAGSTITWFALTGVMFLVLTWIPRPSYSYSAGQFLKLAIATVVIGMMLYFVMGVAPAPPMAGKIVIEATGDRNGSAQSSEVWVRLLVDGEPVSPRSFSVSTGWEQRGAMMLSLPGSQPTQLEWSGQFDHGIAAEFVSHPWSGQAIITVNGRTLSLDLYDDPGGEVEVPLAGRPAPADGFAQLPTGLQWRTAASDAISLGTLAMLFLIACTTRGGRVEERASVTLSDVVVLSTPLLLTGVFWALVYAPAPMTSDSLDQWRQAGTPLSINTYHSVLYTLFLAASRRIADTPALPALVQLVLYALACAWFAAEARRAARAPTWTAWAGVILLSAYPLTAVLSITLWKDIPYATSVIALGAAAIRFGVDRSGAVLHWKWVGALAALMFACINLRHNGPPVALAVVVALWFSTRQHKKLAVVLLVGMGSSLVFKGPVTNHLADVRASPSFALFSHHIAAHLARGHLPEAADHLVLLERINATGLDWPYRCTTVDPTVFNPSFDAEHAMLHRVELARIAMALALRRPDIEARHLACVTSIIWRATSTGAPVAYLSGIPLWAPEGRVRWLMGSGEDPSEDSFVPEIAEAFGRWYVQTQDNWYWRPAAWLFMLMLASAVAWGRTGEPRVLLIAALPLIHTLALAPALLAQDARYQLPVYMAALLAAPVLMAARRGPRAVWTLRETTAGSGAANSSSESCR